MTQFSAEKRICEDPIHRAGVAKLTPDERPAQAFGWIEFTNRLRGISPRKEGKRPRQTLSAGGET